MTSVLGRCRIYSELFRSQRVVELTDTDGRGCRSRRERYTGGGVGCIRPDGPSAALSADNVEGVNKAVMMQLAFVGATAVQLFVCEKSAALSARECHTRDGQRRAFPVFVRVRGKDDELPGPVGGKFSDA